MSSFTPEPHVGVVEDDPTRPYKAYIAAAVAFLAAFGTALLLEWTDTDPLEARDFVVALVFALLGGGVTGGATFGVRNPKRSRMLNQ